MKKIILTTALFVLITNLSIAETRTLNLGEFTRISVRNIIYIQLIQSDRNEIIFLDNAFPEIDITVSGGNLMLSSTRLMSGHGIRTEPMISILFKSLESLQVEQSARVSSEGKITGERLELQLSGTSRTTLLLEHNEVNVIASGASRLTLSGVAQTLQIQNSGSSSTNAEELETQKANFMLSGAAIAGVNTKIATGSMSGASVLHLNSGAESRVTQSGTAVLHTGTPMPYNRGVVIVPSTNQQTLRETLRANRRASRFNPVYSTFDFGINGFGQDFFQNTLSEEWEDMRLALHRSFTIKVNFMNWGVRLGQSNFGVGTAVGMSWNIYRFLEHDMIPQADRENRLFAINQYEGDDRNFRKSNLRSSWVRVPLFVQYRNGRFSALVGVVGNVRMGASSKQVWTVPDSSRRQRLVSRDDFYLNSFRADAEIRIAYRQLGVFATYGLTEMFMRNRGPELNTFSFGISLGLH